MLVGVQDVSPALENPTGYPRNQTGLIGTMKQGD
jgi:hypothetical protein